MQRVVIGRSRIEITAASDYALRANPTYVADARKPNVATQKPLGFVPRPNLRARFRGRDSDPSPPNCVRIIPHWSAMLSLPFRHARIEMQELFVDTPAALAALADRLADSEWLALDTEFIREKTYRPRRQPIRC